MCLFQCGSYTWPGVPPSQVLNKLGIHTIGELANTDVNLLVSHLKSHGRLLWEYANGIDDRPVESLPARPRVWEIPLLSPRMS